MTTGQYFIGKSSKVYTYEDIANLIKRRAPHAAGMHIFEQLKAINLLSELEGGVTPCELPFSFYYGETNE